MNYQRFTILLLLVPIYSIIYSGLHISTTEVIRIEPDSSAYLEMYNGGRPPPFEYRVLTPWLARIVPEPPRWLFARGREVSADWIARVRFAVVNMCFLTLTAIALWYFLRTFDFSALESTLGTLLFLDCTPVVQQSGFPMIDPSAYFFMILGFLAVRLDLPLLLMAAVAIGVFAKETTFALVFAALLAPIERGRKLLMVSALIPAAASYALIRYIIPVSPGGGLFEQWYGHTPLAYMRSLFVPDRALDLLSSFGFLWVFAILALVEGEVPKALRRWSWFIVVILGTMIMTEPNLGRELVLAFPVVIPLALFGIRRRLVLSSKQASSVEGLLAND
jgi:hypothetical protein